MIQAENRRDIRKKKLGRPIEHFEKNSQNSSKDAAKCAGKFSISYSNIIYSYENHPSDRLLRHAI